MDDNDVSQEIWDKIGEQESLRLKIASEFPEHDLVFFIEKYKKFISYGEEELDLLKDQIKKGSGNRRELLKLYTRVEFTYFTIFSIALTMRELLYNFFNKSIGENQIKEYHSRFCDPWKKLGVINLCLAIRNRIQHGKAFDADFKYDVDVVQDKVKWSFEPSEEFWIKVVEECNSSGEQFFQMEVSKEEFKLRFVAKQLKISLKNLAENAHDELSVLFPESSKKKRELEKQLKEIDKYLEDHNIIDPFW